MDKTKFLAYIFLFFNNLLISDVHHNINKKKSAAMSVSLQL